MMRKTYTILAVAFTASACGGVASEAPNNQPTTQDLAQELSNMPLEDALKNRDHFAPLCDEHGYPLTGNINNKSTGAKVSEFCAAIGPKSPQPTPEPPQTKPAPKPAPPPAASCDKDALNRELSGELLDTALAQHQHFRCLCDDKGYPLVGNINAKGATASAFCSALKEKNLL